MRHSSFLPAFALLLVSGIGCGSEAPGTLAAPGPQAAPSTAAPSPGAPVTPTAKPSGTAAMSAECLELRTGYKRLALDWSDLLIGGRSMAKFLDAADEMRDDVEVMEDADVTSCGGDRFAVLQAGFDLQLAYLNVDLAKGAAEDKGYKKVAESGNTVLSCLQVTDVEFDLP